MVIRYVTFSFILAAAMAGASETGRAAQPLRMVDHRGQIQTLDWESDRRLIWVKSGPKGERQKDAPPYVPLVEIRIEAPEGITLKEVEAKEATATKDGSSLVARYGRKGASVVITYETAEKERRKNSLLLEAWPEETDDRVHESCENAKIDLVGESPEGGEAPLAVYCDKKKQGYRLFLFHEANESVRSSRPVAGGKSGRSIFVDVAAPSGEAGSSSVTLATLQMKSSKRKNYEVRVVRRPDSGSRRFYGSGGLGLTYLSYAETQTSQEISQGQIAMTAKGGIGYRIIPEKLDASLSAYVNLFGIPVSESQDGLPNARFLGVNARVGYQLPWKLWGRHPKVSLGAYFWSMMVADDSYGIAQLFAPQLLISAPVGKGGNPSGAAYVKFAPISDVGISFSNFEIAAGGHYRIATWKNRPINATVDISMTQINSLVESSYQASLFTVSLGAMIGLF